MFIDLVVGDPSFTRARAFEKRSLFISFADG